MVANSNSASLFETYADRARRRLEAVLCGEECPWPITPEQRRLLEYMSYHQGRERVMALGELAERLKVTPRAIKELVQDLRLNFRVAICASRDSAAGGYFLAATYAEVQESIAPMLHQAVSMLRVCHAMRGSESSLHELLGQVRLDLEKEVTHVSNA